MKFVRYELENKDYYGILKDNTIQPIIGDVYKDFTEEGAPIATNSVKLLPPVKPTKIIGIGINFYDFVESIGFPIPLKPYIFHKPLSTIVGHKGAIVLPNQEDDIHFEAELAVVIGKEGKDIPKEDAKNYIFGYTCSQDITNKKDFNNDGHMGLAKSYDTFTPIGPYVETNDVPDNTEIKCYINGELKQKGNTNNMIFDVPYLIAYLSSIMTLYPGDVILTGSPAGAGSIKAGDTLEATIGDIGILENTVV